MLLNILIIVSSTLVSNYHCKDTKSVKDSQTEPPQGQNSKKLIVVESGKTNPPEGNQNKSSYKFNKDWDDHWNDYKKTHSKNYESEEEERRRQIWEDTHRANIEHNKLYDQGVHAYRRGFNIYSDMDPSEFGIRYGYKTKSDDSYPHSEEWVNPSNESSSDLRTVDWRDAGIVSPVKDQGSCGSCWAFLATGAIESQMMRKLNISNSLSEQNLLDCSQPQGNKGCGGGTDRDAYEYVIENLGIALEAHYPYQGKTQDMCAYSNDSRGGYLSKYFTIPKGDEEALRQAVALLGPVSAAMDGTNLQHYESGIYHDPNCSKNFNHGGLIVGYGTENGRDYWLIKNCWGPDWGMDGYFKLLRGENHCGIAEQASFPVIKENEISTK